MCIIKVGCSFYTIYNHTWQLEGVPNGNCLFPVYICQSNLITAKYGAFLKHKIRMHFIIANRNFMHKFSMLHISWFIVMYLQVRGTHYLCLPAQFTLIASKWCSCSWHALLGYFKVTDRSVKFLFLIHKELLKIINRVSAMTLQWNFRRLKK